MDPSIATTSVPRLNADVVLDQDVFFDEDDLEKQRSPLEAHIDRAIEFIARVAATPGHRLLLHCHAGASRSPAFACIYLLLAAGAARGGEQAAFDRLLTITNKPWPNLRLTEIAGGLLKRGGALVEPRVAYRRRHPRRGEAYARLNRRRTL